MRIFPWKRREKGTERNGKHSKRTYMEVSLQVGEASLMVTVDYIHTKIQEEQKPVSTLCVENTGKDCAQDYYNSFDDNMEII